MAAAASQPAAAASLQIRLADLAGDKFKDVFYAIFDSHRNVSQRVTIHPKSTIKQLPNAMT